MSYGFLQSERGSLRWDSPALMLVIALGFLSAFALRADGRLLNCR